MERMPEIDAQRCRQTEIDQKQLHHQRNPAENPGVERPNDVEDFDAGDLHQSDDQPDDQPEENADHCQLDRCDRRFQEIGQCLDDNIPIPVNSP